MKNFKQINRKCFACSEQFAQHIGSIKYLLHDNCLLQPAVEIVSCERCGAIFYDTRANFLDYATYYSEQEWYSTAITCGTGIDNPHELKRYESISKSLSSLLCSPTASIVDVGCAKGGLLKVLKKSFKNVFGVDPLPSNVQKINNSGYTAFCATIESLPFEDESCDAIILSHVLEHIFDVEKAINEISRCLSNKGIVYVEVPNAGQYSSCIAAPLLDFHHEHINHFDVVSLDNCFLGRGFQKVSNGVQYLPNGLGGDYSIYAIFSKALASSKTKLVKSWSEEHMRKLFFKHKQYVDALKKLDLDNKTFYSWGLSSYMFLMLAELKDIGIVVNGFFDRDAFKKNQTYNSIAVCDPSGISNLNSNDVVLIPYGPYARDMQFFSLQNNFSSRLFVI